MTLYQYNLLQDYLQLELLWAYGVLIGERNDRSYKIILYQLDGFYVEVFYTIKYDVLKRYRSFNSTDQLEPYFKKLHIELI